MPPFLKHSGCGSPAREIPFPNRGKSARDQALVDQVSALATVELARLGAEGTTVTLRFVGGPLEGETRAQVFEPSPAPGGYYRWEGALELIWVEDAGNGPS